MKLEVITGKMIILLHLTSVMAKRRVFSSLEDTSIEGNIFYYKQCMATTTTMRPYNYDGARSDKEDDEPLQLKSRQVIKLECKMCVTVCCGDDCECLEQLEPQVSIALQLGPSQCRTCTTMCCGDNCKCKEQLVPITIPNQISSSTVQPESTEGRRAMKTRQYIKRVIAHDGDISAILKDLVRVTLQKVEVMKRRDARRKGATDDSDSYF